MPRRRAGEERLRGVEHVGGGVVGGQVGAERPADVASQLDGRSTRTVVVPAARPAAMSTHRSPTVQLDARSTPWRRRKLDEQPG